MLRTGEVFAGYLIVGRIGAGGMGEVYLAQHPRLERRDALKVLSSDLSSDREFAERFRREANLTAGLWHPHIVGVHDAGETSGRLWLAMDYVEGIDASRLLKQHPTGVPISDVVDIVEAVAGALDFAHNKRLLHRDVKPANILMTSTAPRRIVLADFGIARQIDDADRLTASNMTLGTFSYAAPEQLMGEALDGRTDQYALAATAHHLLVGAPVFDHSNAAVVISRHLNSAPPPLSQYRRELAPLDAVLTRALAKDPDARFETCADFANSLKLAAMGERTQLAPKLTQRPTPLAQSGATSRATVPREPEFSKRNGPQERPAEPLASVEGSRPTRTSQPLILASVVVCVVALLLSATFLLSRKSDDVSTAPATTKEITSRQESSVAALPPSIVSAGKLLVGTNVPYAPAEFMTSDGKIVGFDVDLLEAVAGELGLAVEFRSVDFNSIIPAVESGEFDVGMASFTDTKQREENVDMVNYFSAGTLWAQRANEATINPDSACGIRVAVQETTVQHTDELPARNQACVSRGLDPIKIVSFVGQDQATNAVLNGAADALTADSPVTDYAIKRTNGRLTAAGDFFDTAPYGWPVKKGSSLALALQQALQRLIDSGRYTAVLESWGVERGGVEKATINEGIA
ncbi:bifunctional serine/threonine-protein kinase/transporter substrate-binding domain-containing protein [Mycobacterium sp. C3-094]